MTNPRLECAVSHCHSFAETGMLDEARVELETAQDLLQDEIERTGKENLETHLLMPELNLPRVTPDESFAAFETAAYRLGVENAFGYAQHFYERGDNKAARGWLSYAKTLAKKNGMNIGSRVREIKAQYGDKTRFLGF